MRVTFTSTVLQAPGLLATGIPIPDRVVETLGSSRKPPVVIHIGAYSYRSTVASRYGGFIVPLSAEHRAAAGIVAGQEIAVEIELDELPRTVSPPAELIAAFVGAPPLQAAFDSLSPSRQKAIVAQLADAKTDATRDKRLRSILEDLSK